MPDRSDFVLFLAAASVLAITPGPGIFYVLGRSLAGGRREGIFSAFGTFLGGFVHVFGAALGVSAVLAASAFAFDVVRYAGAAYLVYLGIRMIRTRNVENDTHEPVNRANNPLLQGVATEMLNPKTALFFLSFIPQFISTHRGHVTTQFLLLGAVSVTLNTGADLLVASFAGPLGTRMKRNARFRRRQRTASGVGMIGLGLYVAAADSKMH
jgi:threonine/homoserine/homoserine lactone efflux protein